MPPNSIFFQCYQYFYRFLYFSATQIWDLGQQKQNTMDFAEAVDESDLEAFGFTDDFIFELWGAITDAKSGRLKKWIS